MNGRRDQGRYQEGGLPAADCGRRGGRGGGGRAAWLESQQGVTRVTSLSTWARMPKGTRPCAGDTLGRARETGLGWGSLQWARAMGRRRQGSFHKDECKLIFG